MVSDSKRRLDQRLEQVVLGGEVAVDRADADAAPLAMSSICTLEAVLGETAARGLEHRVAVALGVGAERSLGLVVVSIGHLGRRIVEFITQTEYRFRIVQPKPELRFRLCHELTTRNTGGTR